VAGLRHLGAAPAGLLAEAGITTVGQLRRLGAAGAFRRVLLARGGQASTSLLWVLEGALSGTRWDRLPPGTRRRLLEEVARGA
jgi:hypothetical protein